MKIQLLRPLLNWDTPAELGKGFHQTRHHVGGFFDGSRFNASSFEVGRVTLGKLHWLIGIFAWPQLMIMAVLELLISLDLIKKCLVNGLGGFPPREIAGGDQSSMSNTSMLSLLGKPTNVPVDFVV
ncbi:unnamed protein product [Linum trigynum]|uniref:Uncharacterized protein n=1 Tax=Linum trigynum TaxID=586398 RepID=A0AAV2FW38_9ROSI